MKKHQHLTIGIKQHLGLIDGIYAIAMTLLGFKLPELYSEIIKNNMYESIKTLDLLRWITTYLVVFFLLYEIWAFHRTITEHSKDNATRYQTLITIGILMIVTLLPAVHSAFIEGELNIILGNMGGINIISHDLETTEYFLRFSVYLLMAILALNAAKDEKWSIDLYKRILIRAMIFFILAFVASLGIMENHLYPIPSIIYVILSIFFDNIINMKSSSRFYSDRKI